MIHYRHIYRNGKYGCEYHFEDANDAIPQHVHEPDLAHSVLCLKGVVKVLVGTHVKILSRGDPAYWFDCSISHTIIAVTPCTVIFNEYCHGIPRGYDTLPKDQLEGIIGAPRGMGTPESKYHWPDRQGGDGCNGQASAAGNADNLQSAPGCTNSSVTDSNTEAKS